MNNNEKSPARVEGELTDALRDMQTMWDFHDSRKTVNDATMRAWSKSLSIIERALNQRLAVKEGEEIKRVFLDWWFDRIDNADLFNQFANLLDIRGDEFTEAANIVHPVSDDQQAKDAARGRYMIKYGEWLRDDEEKQTRIAILVPYGSDLSCVATREAAIDAALSTTKQEG